MQTTLFQRGIDHTGIGVADIAASARFYDRALAPLGLRPLMRINREFNPADDVIDPELGGVGYGVDFPVFWIDVFHPHSVQQHMAFRAGSRAEVEAFYIAGRAAGGRDNGPPGLREKGYPPGYYAAFLLDPMVTTSKRSSERKQQARLSRTEADSAVPEARTLNEGRTVSGLSATRPTG